METPGALVVGVDNPAGVELLTSFSLNRISVVALDSNPRARGFYSRHRGRSILLNERSEVPIVRSILALAKELGGWVLIPNDDYFAAVVSRNHARLAEHFKVAIAEWASTRRCIDKALTHEAAESAGVAVPRTFIPTAEHHLEEIASKIDFDTTDWILKPRWKNIDLDGRYGGFSRHVFKHRKAKSVYSKESMIALLLQAYLDTGVFPLIQERIPGGADCLVGVMAVADENLEPIAICPSRKIRQDPTDFGDGSYAETVDDRELVELMARLIKITRCYGFVLAEFKKDPRDGVFRLIEINPRASSRLSLPRAAGVDLSRVLFDTFAGSNNGRIAEFRAGIRWMHPRRELSLMVRERKPGRVLELLRHLGRTKGFAYSLRDPLPFLIDLVPAAAAAVTGRYGTG